jgi:hypothetical protein
LKAASSIDKLRTPSRVEGQGDTEEILAKAGWVLNAFLYPVQPHPLRKARMTSCLPTVAFGAGGCTLWWIDLFLNFELVIFCGGIYAEKIIPKSRCQLAR